MRFEIFIHSYLIILLWKEILSNDSYCELSNEKILTCDGFNVFPYDLIQTASIFQYKIICKDPDEPRTNLTTRQYKFDDVIWLFEINECNIEAIHSQAFYGSNKLEHLLIRNSKVEEIKNNAFSGINGIITVLNLEKNRIRCIRVSAFSNVSILQSLELIDNQIVQIEDHAFKDLESLQRLELSQNAIKSINKETFRGLNNLTSLELKGNQIEELPVDTFYHLTNLHYLLLDVNKIKSISGETFERNKFLSQVSMENNHLTRIESNTFVTLIDNGVISLTGNVLTYVAQDAFNRNSTMPCFLVLSDDAPVATAPDIQSAALFTDPLTIPCSAFISGRLKNELATK